MAVSVPAKADAAMFALICNDQFCTGGNDLIAQDQVTTGNNNANTPDGLAGGAQTGAISINGFLTLANGNVVEVVQNTSISNSPAGNPLLAMTWSAKNTTGLAGDNIWFYVTDTGFNTQSPLVIDVNSTNSSGTGYMYGADDNNNGFNGNVPDVIDLAPLLASGGFTPGLGGDYIASYTQLFPNPFYLVGGATVFVGNTAGATSTGDLTISAVPEPASMLLLGTGLAGVVARMRRKTKKA